MRSCFTATLSGALVLWAGLAQAEPAYDMLNQVLTDNVVIPAYERMASAMAELEAATANLCADPDEAALKNSKQAFHSAMDAWQHAQPFVLGPVMSDGRASRIQFWPDKSGTASRQVRRALQAQDPALVSPGGLNGKSVALQNLGTYERIVFGRGEAIASANAGEQDRYACALAAAIARFQAELAADIYQEWVKQGGFREAVITAPQGNAHYVGADEVATEFLKSLTAALDMTIRLKLERPLGQTIEKARPRRAESWRSGRSLRNIIANLETARALYDAPGGFGDLLAAAGSKPLDLGLRRSLDEIIVLAQSIERPLHVGVADPKTRPQFEALRDRLKEFRLLISGPASDEIGLVVGFNATDGD